MVKHPPQAQAFGYRLILYRKVRQSPIHVYYLFTKKVTNRPPLLFPRVERADCPGLVIKKKKKEKRTSFKKWTVKHSSPQWSKVLIAL